MKSKSVYNLEEFASCYHLQGIFGAYAAYFSVGSDESYASKGTCVSLEDFTKMVGERTLFCKLLLVRKGSALITVSDNECENLTLSQGSLMRLTAKHVITHIELSPDFKAECVLADDKTEITNNIYHIENEKLNYLLDIFHFIRETVTHPYIKKLEMLNSMLNVLRLFIEELPYEQCAISHDLRHKKEVYEIFLHHLYTHFRKQRVIRFYADKLNVSTAYLSRLVKEISGSTVNEHITSLLYKEICNLLLQTDLSMGEIADTLNFSDQSALTNFFKQRSGKTPLAYRKETTKE